MAFRGLRLPAWRMVLASLPPSCQKAAGIHSATFRNDRRGERETAICDNCRHRTRVMAFLLAHLSDPHLPPMPPASLRELAGKRVLGYLNWKRNRHAIHRAEVLDALVGDMQAQRPGHIAVTGDLVNLSLKAEFAPARAWLESVGPPDQVSVVPGNHDAYVQATRHHFAETFAEFMRSDGDTAEDDSVRMPFLRRRGPLALIGVSTAVPTAPLLATGRLGAQQLEALQRILTTLSGEPAFRVLLIHHPLHSKSKYKRLTDSAQLLPLLQRYGVELILHGHDHLHSTMWFDGPHRRIPAIGVPSASSLAHGRYPGAAYNLFTIERDGESWRCEHRVRGIDQALHVVELGRTML
jgi:3',5'-cyclic AMP phosphodiesterase CpdA